MTLMKTPRSMKAMSVSLTLHPSPGAGEGSVEKSRCDFHVMEEQ